MVKTSYFKGVQTLTELKTAYKKFAVIFHPDNNGGNDEQMKEVNAEYDEVFKRMKDDFNAAADEEHQMSEMPEQYRNIIINIMNIEGIEIELCGSWIWVSGNTKDCKDVLKDNGFFWASKKVMWYWRADEFRSKSRKSQDIETIRNKYGSEKIKANVQSKLN